MNIQQRRANAFHQITAERDHYKASADKLAEVVRHALKLEIAVGLAACGRNVRYYEDALAEYGKSKGSQ